MKMRILKPSVLAASVLALAGCVVAPVAPVATVPAGPGPAPAYGAWPLQSPPPDRLEHRSPPPAVGYLWISGYWIWLSGSYQWQPGHWEAPRPGYVWVPHVWRRDGERWLQEGGRWEEDERRRDFRRDRGEDRRRQ